MNENRGNFTRPQSETYLSHEPEVTKEQLSDRIWTVSDGHCRVLFVEGDRSVIAFDTLGTPGRARAYKRAIHEAIPGKPIETLIYTHDHLDHAGFAANIAPDANIIADEICAKVVKLRRAQGQIQPTTVLCGPRNEMRIDGVEFTLLNPGPTHGSGNISAHFVKEGILYSCDTILANARYGFLPDYHIANFVKLMRGFLGLDWDTFVPGRYELTDRSGFERGCDLIAAVQLECQNAFAEFVPIWQLEPMRQYVGNKLSQRFGTMDGFDDHIGLMSIRVVHHYLMGGWGLEDTTDPGVMLAEEVTL